MEQELIYKDIAIIGCGAAGGMAGILLSKNPCNRVIAFDEREPFSTLLPTGGGRCNLTYSESDVREFVKNYSRGEKFLISVFSRFGQEKTRELFADLGIKTYVQSDNRVFPVNNSSAKTVQILRKHLDNSNFLFKKEKVTEIAKKSGKFEITTSEGIYEFDNVIITTGGKGNGFELAAKLSHNIIEPKPSLCALDILETDFYNLAGVSFKNAEISSSLNKKKFKTVCGDILFAHKSITGPGVFKVSSLTAFEEFSRENPIELTLKLTDKSAEDIEKLIALNSKKTVKNIFSMLAPESFVSEILKRNKTDECKQAAQLRKSEKEIIINSLIALKLHACGRIKGSEIVSAGGVDLNEIDSKTMESKLVKGLYFAGEIMNIDGYTGGFNLQNCWSSAYICSSSLN